MLIDEKLIKLLKLRIDRKLLIALGVFAVIIFLAGSYFLFIDNDNNLPRNFDECVRQGRPVTEGHFPLPSGPNCWFEAWQNKNPKLYKECRTLGGAELFDELYYGCRIIFPQKGPPCLSGFCT